MKAKEGDIMSEGRITTFSDRLKEYMSMNDVRAVDLAKRFRVSRSTISQYLSGAVVPKRDRLVLIADALNLSPLWLMGYDVPPERETPLPDDLTQDERHIVIAYRNASDEIKSAVKAVLGIKKGIESRKEGIS